MRTVRRVRHGALRAGAWGARGSRNAFAEYVLPHVEERRWGRTLSFRFLFLAAAGFHAHFGDVEQAVKHVLAGIDVLDS